MKFDGLVQDKVRLFRMTRWIVLKTITPYETFEGGYKPYRCLKDPRSCSYWISCFSFSVQKESPVFLSCPPQRHPKYPETASPEPCAH